MLRINHFTAGEISFLCLYFIIDKPHKNLKKNKNFLVFYIVPTLQL